MTPSPSTASTMETWQVPCTGPLESTLQLYNIIAPLPSSLPTGHVLIRVAAAGLNPAEYKLAGMPLVGNYMYGRLPSTPGMDFSGTVAATHADVSEYAVGERVFGRFSLLDRTKYTKYGALGEFIVVPAKNHLAPIPEGLDTVEAAGLGTAGLTALQTLAPYTKPGQSVLIVGASGGVGTFTVQVAKALGLRVVGICSTEKAALVHELGADEIIDYKTQNVVEVLKYRGQEFDHVVDNVGDSALYAASSWFTKPDAVWVGIAGDAKSFTTTAAYKWVPAIFGGAGRAQKMIFTQQKGEDMLRLAEFVKEGSLKVVVDSVWEWEDAPKAYGHLAKWSSKGKVIVKVKQSSV